MTDSYDPNSPASHTSIPSEQEVPTSQRYSGLAITALVLGIPGVCVFPLGILALILGIIALVQIADPKRALTGRGMAVTATVLGGLSILDYPLPAHRHPPARAGCRSTHRAEDEKHHADPGRHPGDDYLLQPERELLPRARFKW